MRNYFTKIYNNSITSNNNLEFKDFPTAAFFFGVRMTLRTK